MDEPAAHDSAVSNFVGGVIGTKLYVAGGLRWEQGWRIASDELQVFDFETRTWSLGPDLPGPRYYGAGCVCDGRLYVVGGKDESRSLTRSVIVFSPESPAGWSQVTSLPEFRYYHSCCNYKNKLLVFGGEGDGEAFPPLVLSSITGAGTYRPPEEQLWLSEALRNEILDVLGRALASGDEGFSVPLSSLKEPLTAPTLVRGTLLGQRRTNLVLIHDSAIRRHAQLREPRARLKAIRAAQRRRRGTIHPAAPGRLRPPTPRGHRLQRARRLSGIWPPRVPGGHQAALASIISTRRSVCDRESFFLEVEVGAEVALEAREDALGRVVRAPGDGHELAVGLARGHVLDGEAARPVGDAEARRLPVSRRRRGRVFHAVVVLRGRRQISIY